MSQEVAQSSESNTVVVNQPVANVVAALPVGADPAPAPAPSFWSTCWHAILPCLEVALQVGSAEAQEAINARLANNTSLTEARKAQIANSAANAIQNQRQITVKAINKVVDNHTNINTVIGEFGKETAGNVASSAAGLINIATEQGQKLVKEKLAAKLTHAGLSESAVQTLTNTINASLATQANLTEKAIDEVINHNITVFTAAKHYASETSKNAATVVTDVINVASDVGQHFIAQKLADKLENLGLSPVESDQLAKSVNAALVTQTNLTEVLVEKIMCQQIGIFSATKLYASATAGNVAAGVQAFIDVGSDVAQGKLKEQLDDAFKNVNPAIAKIMVDSIMQTAIKEGNLAEATLNHLIASHINLASGVQSHVADSLLHTTESNTDGHLALGGDVAHANDATHAQDAAV